MKTARAVARAKAAAQRYAARRTEYEAFHAGYEAKHDAVVRQFCKLAETRLKAFAAMREAVGFLGRARLRPRKLREQFNITPQEMVSWQKASANAPEVLGGIAAAGSSGAAIAAGAYGLVGALASASTGTAIAELSGVAASNATLAWLGGGTLAVGGGGMAAGTLVLGGLVAGPAIALVGFVADLQVAKIDAQVEELMAELDRDEAGKGQVMSELDVIAKRVLELRRSTTRLRNQLTKLLQQGDPAKEGDAYAVAKVAKALGNLLEVTIIDEQGRPTP